MFPCKVVDHKKAGGNQRPSDKIDISHLVCLQDESGRDDQHGLRQGLLVSQTTIDIELLNHRLKHLIETGTLYFSSQYFLCHIGSWLLSLPQKLATHLDKVQIPPTALTSPISHLFSVFTLKPHPQPGLPERSRSLIKSYPDFRTNNCAPAFRLSSVLR